MLQTYHTIVRRLQAVQMPEGEARAIAFLIMEKVLGASRTDVYADKVMHFSPLRFARLEIITRRLEAGEPVQYILGEADFMGRTFRVSPAVLIPRPETEDLVRIALAEAPCAQRVLEIGTGSGCIAISIKALRPEAAVEAWDISPRSLAVARSNAEEHGVQVAFHQRDALSAVPAAEGYDLLVSNPPYVLERERAEIDARVLQHEPALALFVPDDDPLRFYRAIARIGKQGLRAGGTLAVETNTAFTAATAELFRCEGYTAVAEHLDCFGRPRFVVARKA